MPCTVQDEPSLKKECSVSTPLLVMPEKKIALEEIEWILSEGNACAIKQGLKFNLEKITSVNKGQWLNYANAQSGNSGSNYFRDMIKSALSDSNEVWAAYAQRNKPKAPIEIFFAVRSCIGHPVTVHNGISISAEHTIRGLSMPLHGFAGAAMKKLFPGKEYMRVAPVNDMITIMLMKMPVQSLWVEVPEEEIDSAKLRWPSIIGNRFPVELGFKKFETASDGLESVQVYPRAPGLYDGMLGTHMCCKISTLVTVFETCDLKDKVLSQAQRLATVQAAAETTETALEDATMGPVTRFTEQDSSAKGKLQEGELTKTLEKITIDNAH